jgi:hypothetical protein
MKHVLLMLLLTAPPAFAQGVRGTATDRSTAKPVAGAEVTLLGEGTRPVRSTTDAAGAYRLVAPGPGQYRIRFEAPGYRLLISPPFELRADQTLDLPLQVSPVPAIALDTAIVQGKAVPRFLQDFYERRAKGLGKFVTREEFEHYSPQYLTDIMVHEGAFTVTPNSRRGAGGDYSRYHINSARAIGGGFGPVHGECPPLIYMDGVLMGNARDVDVDDIISVGDVAAMEFYEGVEVPLEFQANGSNCGVLVAWSRREGGGAGAPVVHRVELGSEVGGRVASGGLETGRVGVQALIGLVGPVAVHATYSRLLPSLHGTAAPLTGWQVTADLRARPLGANSPWYVGAGLSSLNVRDQGAGSEPATSQSGPLLLTGLSTSVSFLQPMLEFQLLSPFAGAKRQVAVFTGVAVRLQ